MKAARLELKGLRCVEYAQVQGLCYPLFAVIEFNGFVVTAQSIVRGASLPLEISPSHYNEVCFIAPNRSIYTGLRQQRRWPHVCLHGRDCKAEGTGAR